MCLTCNVHSFKDNRIIADGEGGLKNDRIFAHDNQRVVVDAVVE